MKKITIITFITLAFLTVSGCKKDGSANDTPRPEATENTMSVAVNLFGSKAIYFPNEEQGLLAFDSGRITIFSVPVDANGDLEWDKYVSGRTNWAEVAEARNSNTIYSNTRKTVSEWFANATEVDGEKRCVFFGVLTSDSSDLNDYLLRRYFDTDGTSILYEISSPEDWFVTRQDGKTFAKVRIDYWQEMHHDRKDDSAPWYVRGIRHIIGAHSDVLTESEVMNARFVNLSGFNPSNVLLRFKMTATKDDFNLYKLIVRVEPTGDNLAGYAFIDFSDYLNNNYPIMSATAYMDAYGEPIIHYPSQYVKQADGTFEATGYSDYIDTNYSDHVAHANGWDSYDQEDDDYRWTSTIPVSSSSLTDDVYLSFYPQTTGITSDSYIIFDAYDENEFLVRSVKKKIPAGGFRGGIRYDFTLTFGGANTIVTDNAGFYIEDEW